jgi:hypothetical protein
MRDLLKTILQMKSDIIYVEKINGSSLDGEAWIGKCTYSKSGLSIYFNGKGFKRQKSFSSNYYDLDTGEDYWISKVKTNGEDGHKFGKVKINIDKSVVEEYLKLINQNTLEKNKFQIVELNNIPAKEKANQIENEKSENDDFDYTLRFKNQKSITKKELENLVCHYKDVEINGPYKKARKYLKKYLENIESELDRRKNSNLA